MVATGNQSMRRYLTIISAALVLVLGVGAPRPVSAKTYSLEECLTLAKENRASITKALGDKRNAKASVRRQFGRLILPNISGSYRLSESRERDQTSEALVDPNPPIFDSVLTNGGRWLPIAFDTSDVTEVVTTDVPDQDRSSKSLSVQASLTLFDGLSNIHDYLGVKKASEAADFDLERAKQNLELTVKAAYFTYLANVRNLAVQEEAVKRSEEQLNLVQSKYDVGSASLSDVLKQKVQFGNDNLTLLEAQQGVITSKSDLAFSVGLDPSDNDDFDTTYTERGYTGEVDGAIETALASHPGLKSSDLNFQMQKQFLKSAYGDYLPRITASASRSWSTSSRPDNLDRSLDFKGTSTSFGITISMNIFDQMVREQNVVRNSVARNNARADLQEARNNVVLETQKAYYEVEKATEQVKVSEENVASATEDMNLAREKYNLGSASILDLLDAQVSLKQAQVSLIRAQLDLNVAVARLDNAMGVSTQGAGADN